LVKNKPLAFKFVVIIMMRVTAIILLFLGTFHFGKNIVLVANYAIDYEYISKVLCINKNKPKSKCNGKCHLAKQIKKGEPAQSEQSNSAIINQIEFLFYFMISEDLDMDCLIEKNSRQFIEFNQNTLDYYDEVPVPPPLLS